MMLSGKSAMSFLLEPTSATDDTVALRPGWVYGELPSADNTVGDSYGPPQVWTMDEVAAAADWWRRVALDREPIDERHVWFGGGVAFGRVSAWECSDVAIDVIVLSRPDAGRPGINYYGGSVELDISDLGPEGRTLDYVTIDTTAEQIARAADWWHSILQ